MSKYIFMIYQLFSMSQPRKLLFQVFNPRFYAVSVTFCTFPFRDFYFLNFKSAFRFHTFGPLSHFFLVTFWGVSFEFILLQTLKAKSGRYLLMRPFPGTVTYPILQISESPIECSSPHPSSIHHGFAIDRFSLSHFACK